MSNTYRRKNSYDEYWYTKWYFEFDENQINSKEYYSAKYHSDACSTMHQCPSWFKRMLRKHFRHQCKQVLRNAKAGNIEYDNLVFPVSCKTALWEWW